MRSMLFWCMLLVAGCAMRIAWAGQMAGHEYTALSAMIWFTGTARTLVEANQDAYLSGAQGPDTTGIVMYNLNLAFNAVGEESHYSDKKAELALAILDAAKSDREKAYALGWISHYINDSFVHPVVNDYGGYYATDPKHHKELEQLETKHVLMKHGDLVTQEMSNNLPMTFGPTFAGFIFDGYHAAFPEESRYQTGKEWVGSNKDYFCRRYNEASAWSLAASQDFYQAHSNGSGKHGSLESWTESLAIWKLFPPMPSAKEYDALQNPLDITVVKPFNDRIEVTAEVHDSKHYARFPVDWETAAVAAQQYSAQVFSLASDYLEATDGERKAEIRRQLLAVIPNANLDQPHADFVPAKALPGSADCERLAYQLTVFPQTGNREQMKPVVIEGQSTPIVYGKEEGFAGSKSGTVTFQIPLPKNQPVYRFALLVGLTDLAAFKRPEYRDVDWRKVEGTSNGIDAPGPGAVRVGSPFSVHIPLPPAMAKQPGERRWLVMRKGHNMTLEEIVDYTDDDANEHFYRVDVLALNEKVSATAVDATLQVTGIDADEQRLLEDAELVMLWFAPGRATAQGKSPFDRLVKAGKLTQAQVTKFTQNLTAYIKGLTNINAEQEAALIDLKQRTELAKLGIGPEDITGVCYTAAVPLDLYGARLKVTLPSGWSPVKSPGELAQYATMDRHVEDTKGNDKWEIAARLKIIVSTKPEDVKTNDFKDADPPKALPQGDALSGYQTAFADAHAGETAQPLTIDGFSGVRYEKRTQKNAAGEPLDVEIRGEALLRKGAVYLEIIYLLDAQASRITDWQDGKSVLLYDGNADTTTAVEQAQKDIQAMWRSIALEPVR